jgi:hypothetical protein
MRRKPVPVAARSKAYVLVAWWLGSWVRIPIESWMFLRLYVVLLEALATAWSLVQRSPTVCLVKITKRQVWGVQIRYKYYIDHELIPSRNASLAAMQCSASGSSVRYYPTWKHSPFKERNKQCCYNATHVLRCELFFRVYSHVTWSKCQIMLKNLTECKRTHFLFTGH